MTAILTNKHRARLALTDEAWSALEAETRDTIRSSCLGKVDFRHRPEGIAAQKRRAGARDYRCPFCGGKHLTTHAPSIDDLARIARAIRDVHGNAPAR